MSRNKGRENFSFSSKDKFVIIQTEPLKGGRCNDRNSIHAVSLALRIFLALFFPTEDSLYPGYLSVSDPGRSLSVFEKPESLPRMLCNFFRYFLVFPVFCGLGSSHPLRDFSPPIFPSRHHGLPDPGPASGAPAAGDSVFPAFWRRSGFPSGLPRPESGNRHREVPESAGRFAGTEPAAKRKKQNTAGKAGL